MSRSDDATPGVYGLSHSYGSGHAPSLEVPDAAAGGIARRDSAAEEKGRLDLPLLSRFFCIHPLGFIAYLLVLASIFVCFMVAISDKAKQSPSDALFAHYLAWFVGIGTAIAGVISWFWIRASEGKRSACPRCNAWFSALVMRSDAMVLSSREDTMTYTGQAAIRDRESRVIGYVDEQRTMPVTVKTVLGVTKCRCKSCGHRWETSDVRTAIG